MATTKVAYASDAALAVTAWGTALATGEFATSAIFDNTSSLYVDVLVGGIIEGDTATGVIALGDTFDIYVVGQYSETALDMGGGIDALLSAAAEQVEDVDFVKNNLILLKSIAVESTTPDIDQGYHFGPIGIAQFFGGIMPKRFMLVLHNNSGATLGGSSNVNTTGITYNTV